MKRNKYEIREICGDWALDIRRGADTITLFFNSRNNAELVKTIFEWEDAHPNEAAPYTFPSPNDWISVKDRLPESEKPVLTFVGYPESMVGFITVSTYYCFDKTPHWQWDGLLRDEQRTLFWMPLPQPPKEAQP